MQHIWPKSVVMTHTPYKWLKWSYPFHWCIQIPLWENLLIHTWFTSDSISLLEDVKVFSCGILGALALGPSALAAARFGAMLFFKGLQTGMRQREGSKAAEDGGSMAEAECKSKGPFRKTAGSKISPECKALFHDLIWIALIYWTVAGPPLLLCRLRFLGGDKHAPRPANATHAIQMPSALL